MPKPSLTVKAANAAMGLTYRKCVARVMLDEGETYEAITAKTGLAKSTIAKVKKGDYQFPQGMVAAIRGQARDKWEVRAALAGDLLDEKLLDPTESKKISAGTLLIVAGTAQDKAIALRDEGTGDASDFDETTALVEGASYLELKQLVQNLAGKLNAVADTMEAAETVVDVTETAETITTGSE